MSKATDAMARPRNEGDLGIVEVYYGLGRGKDDDAIIR